MNICIANIQECNPLIGGVERVSSILANEWKLMGISVSILSQFRKKPKVEYNPEVKQYYLPYPDNLFSVENRQFTETLFKDNKIDIIVNQSPNYFEYSKFLHQIKNELSIRLISVYHYTPHYNVIAQQNNFYIAGKNKFCVSNCLKQLMQFVYFYLYKKNKSLKNEQIYYKSLYDQSDAFVVLSKYYIKEVKNILGLSDDNSNRLFAISNPILLNDIQPNLSAKKKQIIYVGRLEYGLKRVDRLINIWNRLYKDYLDWELVIVGGGDFRHNFEQMVQSKKIQRIKFEGFKNPVSYLSEASILCMTSSTEGFGMVLVEAQQNGCVPVVYDSFGAAHDIITDGENGVLVKPFSEDEYVCKLRKLMDDKQFREKLAINGMESVKIFDAHKIAKQWIEIFKKIKV